MATSLNNHVDVDESDVENQVRNMRQMVGHGLCTGDLAANTNYTALLPTVNTGKNTLGLTCIQCCTAIIHRCVDMYRHNLPPQNEVASTA